MQIFGTIGMKAHTHTHKSLKGNPEAVDIGKPAKYSDCVNLKPNSPSGFYRQMFWNLSSVCILGEF